MKRGCFFGFSFIIITIGIAFYIGQKYGDKIYNYGSEKANEFYNEQIKTELDNLSGTYSDSVKNFLDKRIELLKKKQIKLSLEQIEKLKEELKSWSKKPVVDSTDFNNLKRIFL